MIIQPADRLDDLQEYYFSKKLKEVNRLKAEGRPIINMGIGNPDLAPHDSVIAALLTHAEEKQNHGYQPYQGIAELREAIVGFSAKKFGIELIGNEVLPLIGSKEGITHVSLAYLNPGDKVLVPELGYPTYTSVTKMVGAIPIYYPLIADKNWEPDWGFLEAHDYSDTKMIWINYPHMPTGQKGSLELLEKFVKLAKAKGVLLCHDNPYSFIQNDNPLSVFNVKGAKEVAVELNSLSKTFNMAGWRVGWLAGDQETLAPVLKIKSNMDSGMFKPIQMAAISALSMGEDWFEQIIETYSGRRELVNIFLNKLGCSTDADQSGMFVWAKIPSGTADQMCDQMLYEKDIFVTPGHIFGDKGAAHIRVSLCIDDSLIQEAINRLL